MAILPGTGYSSIYNTSTTAQDILDQVSREMRGVLNSAVAADQTIMFDFLNRTQLTLLRASRWDFVLSEPLYFMTQEGQSQYWLGETGVAPPGVVDTLLNLNNVDIIKRSSVRDVSNGRWLMKMDDAPFYPALSTPDAQFRQGRPAVFTQDLIQPALIKIRPEPDNENGFQPEPPTPYCSSVPGGSLDARTYYVKITFLDSLDNESTPSADEAIITVPAGMLLRVHTPLLPHNVTAQGVSYDRFNVYVSETSQSEELQSTVAVNMGSNWTEPTTGLISGVAPPTENEVTVLGGYIIEFRYYASRQILSEPEDVDAILQTPDVYRDILCAGVNWLASRYLRMAAESDYWQALFQQGLREMVRDRNMIPRENDYLHPDDAGLGIGSNRGYTYGFDALR